MTKSSRYMYRKRDTYYFSRRVPSDIQGRYSRNRIVLCLRTNSAVVAERSANNLAVKLDDYWAKLRLHDIDLPASHLILSEPAANQSGPTLSDALEIYLSLKAEGRDKVFIRTANRNIELVIDLLGDRYIGAYASSDAAKFRDHLFDRGLYRLLLNWVIACNRN